jgi:2-oxoglutarate ferredoxin oxidoreductase subunit alpha
MMEPAELPPMMERNVARPDWAVRGAEGREKRFLSSIYIQADEEEITNIRLFERWLAIQDQEVRYKEYFLDDAEVVVVGFGTAGRVAYSAVRQARAEGLRVGLLRPITLSPFPSNPITELAKTAKAFLVVEMNAGQMLDDVRVAVGARVPVEFYGRLGGVVPFQEEILSEIKRTFSEPLSIQDDPRRTWIKRLKAAIN